MKSTSRKVILASKSPRRKQIMEWADFSFEIITQNTPEDIPENAEPRSVPEYLASLKGKAVAATVDLENSLVIAADTIVLLNEKIYGKPVDRNDAIAILKELSGKTHEVITGVSLHWNREHHSFSETTRVWFDNLTADEINYYIDTFKPYDKAGAYAIQEWIGVTTIKKVDGCFFNVMGLPMNRLYHEMKRLGFVAD